MDIYKLYSTVIYGAELYLKANEQFMDLKIIIMILLII